MSYILDALKKAERQRSLGQVPTLETSHADDVAPRRRAWSWIWAAVLAVNGILLLLILRYPENPHSAPQAAPRSAPQTVVTHQPAAGGRSGSPLMLAVNERAIVPAAAIQAATRTAVQDKPAAAPVTPASASSGPAAHAVAQAAPPAGRAVPAIHAKPAQAPSDRAQSHAAPAAQKSTAQPADRSPSHGSPPVHLAQQRGHTAAHPSVSTPITAPVPAAAPPPASRPVPAASAAVPPPAPAPVQPAAGPVHAAEPDAASVRASAAPSPAAPIPLLRDLPFEFQKTVPPVRIDAMVYSDDERSRMAFLNGHKYREGEKVEGSELRVETILRQGVVLSLGGQRFLLTP